MSGSKNGTSSIASIVGFAMGFLVMRSLGPETSIRILAGSAAGLALCLLPYLLARSRDRISFARGTLWSGAIVGAVGGALLTAPLALVLSLVAVWRGSPAPST